MHRIARGKVLASLVAATSLALVIAPLTVPAQAAPTPVVDPALARSPELSETTRLADRRTVVTGDRAWALGTADGYYPAAGFHTRGRDGRVLAAQSQAAGRHVVRHQRRLDRSGHQDDDRLGLCARRPAGHRRGRGQPDRRGAGRGLRRAGRAEPALGHDQDDHAAGGRAFGAAGLLPVGGDHAQPDRRQSARLGGGPRQAPGVHRPGHAAEVQRRVAQLGRGVRHRPGPDRLRHRAELPRPAGRDPAICPASGPNAPPSPSTATTPSTARAPAAS